MSEESGQVDTSKFNLLLEKWIEIRLEIDKALFLASLGIIGYILTFLATKTDLEFNQQVAFILSLAIFSIEIILFLVIMLGNASLLQNLLGNKDTKSLEARLSVLDYLALGLFILGLAATILGSTMNLVFTGECNG